MSTAVLLSPIFNEVDYQDNLGNPASGWLIYTYVAGSNSTLLTTYTEYTGTVPNANPIVLDSSGTQPAAMWLQAGQAYNIVFTSPDGTTVRKGYDNVQGAITTLPTNSSNPIWVSEGAVTFLNGTQFQISGDQVLPFAVGNRVRLTVASGYRYGTVSAVAYSSPNTQVTIVNDGSALDPSLSLAEYSLLIAMPGSTVDAGGVTYTSSLPYSTTNTVGNALKALNTAVNTTGINVAHGTGIGVSGTPVVAGGTVTINNTGVTSIVAGSNVTVSGATGAVTVNATSSVTASRHGTNGYIKFPDGTQMAWGTTTTGLSGSYTQVTFTSLSIPAFANQLSNITISYVGEVAYMWTDTWTTTGFRCYGRDSSSTAQNYTIHWHAVGY